MSTPMEAPAPESAPMVRIVIDFNPMTGEIGVVGPIENPTLFFGIVETAKMIVIEQRAKAKAPLVVPAPANFNLVKH